MQLPGISFAKSYGATGYWRSSWLGFDGVTRFKNELDGPLREQMLAVNPVAHVEMDSVSNNQVTFGSANLTMWHNGTSSIINALPTPSITVRGRSYTGTTSHCYSLTTYSCPTINNTNPITIMAFVKPNASITASEQVIMGLYGSTGTQNFIELFMTHDGAGHRPAFRWGTPNTVNGTIDDQFQGTISSDQYAGDQYIGYFDGFVHVAAVINGSSATLYMNGQLVSTEDFGGAFSQTMGSRTLSIGARRLGSTVSLASQAQFTNVAVYNVSMTRAQIAKIAACGLRSKDCEMQTDADVIPFPSPFDRQAQGVVVSNANKMTRLPKTHSGDFCYEILEDGTRGFTVVMELSKINIAAMTTGQKHTLFDMLRDSDNFGGGIGGTVTAYSWGQVYLYKLNATTVWLEASWGSGGSGSAGNSVMVSSLSFTDIKRGHIAVVFGTNTSSTNCLEIYVNGVKKYTQPIQVGDNAGLGNWNVMVPSWHELIGLTRNESSEGSSYVAPRVTSGPFAFFPTRLSSGQVNKLFRVWKGIRGNRHRFNHRLPRRYFQYHGPTRQV